MTKLFIQLFLFFGLNQIAFSKNIDCAAFIERQFVLEDKTSVNTFITRTKTTQIEFQDYTKLNFEFKINWTNDCTNTLKIKKILENQGNQPHPKNRVVTCQILDKMKSSYIQKSRAKDIEFTVTSEIIKLQ
ncbi:MAG: hypothetical protein K9H61_11960 [Bacteroidia bacterium]|nr:hypothetical protein [Bacteroidia bacterium]MCF8427556.1 hypothetical protein [Bacteroidia bacterium]MCF8447701.1 hypothetical protein [Bacteroidia bacterium]